MTMNMSEIKCPKCGATHFFINYSTSTALYCPMKYKNGELIINNDPNYYTYNCTCAECNQIFSYTIHQGKLLETNIDLSISREIVEAIKENLTVNPGVLCNGNTITIEGKSIN